MAFIVESLGKYHFVICHAWRARPRRLVEIGDRMVVVCIRMMVVCMRMIDAKEIYSTA